MNPQPTTSFHLALQSHHEWSTTCVLNRTDHDFMQQKPPSSWTKPPPGFLKINIDVAVFIDENKFSVDICIRDALDHFVSVKLLHFEGSPEPREAEVLQGLLWAHELGLQNIMFELDCKSAVDGICERSTGNSDFNVLLAQCRSLFSNFSNSMVSFIRRSANIVAHCSARASISYARIQSLIIFQIESFIKMS